MRADAGTPTPIAAPVVSRADIASRRECTVYLTVMLERERSKPRRQVLRELNGVASVRISCRIDRPRQRLLQQHNDQCAGDR